MKLLLKLSVGLVVLALLFGVLAFSGYRDQAAIDEKRQLFERRGKKSTCEVLDVSQIASSYVTKTRRGVVVHRGPEIVTSSTVKCRFVANGTERTDAFDVPYDFEKRVRQIDEMLELSESMGSLGGGESIRQQAIESRRRHREALLTVTYLEDAPERAVLGPLDSYFPKQREGSTYATVAGVALALAAFLAVVAFMLRPRPVEPGQ
ncbi:MAG: hypothetical protein DI536_25080 [Archangium gephyra]|uniref:Uncharacterized protein n=1 Tax=Archangium gephyra TaxID=48 RepID=A0A2W5T073_9BACT|nr:MAG: hypothetical protein DI536_25080 [Archangium gephyra]